MNIGLDLSFLIPIDFWDYMWYATFFVVLTLIPAVLNLRYNNEISVTQLLLFMIGSAGIFYSVFKAWLVVPSNSSLHYLALAFFTLVLVVLACINLVLKAKCNIEGLSSNECFVSLFTLIIFAIATLVSMFKAWFVIPPDGYMDYFRFACIWGLFALLCAAGLAVLIFKCNDFKGGWLIFGGLGFFFLMEMIYSLLKTWDAMPNIVKYTVIVVVGFCILAMTGAFGVGTSRYSSE